VWTKSLLGTPNKSSGSRSSLLFLSVLCFFSVFSLSGQDLPSTQPSPKYSEMTRAELLTQIADKDSLILEWLTWSEKEKALRKEQDEAYREQLSSRDKLIRDQALVIAGYQSQEAMGWLERALWGLGGAGVGFVGGHFSR